MQLSGLPNARSISHQFVSMDEIASAAMALPSGDPAAENAARSRQQNLTKPEGSLGRLEEVACWMARWQSRPQPRADVIRAVVFASDHGVAAQGVSAFPQAVTAQMVQNFERGGAAINVLCRALSIELSIENLSVGTPTGDLSIEPAMDRESFIEAFNVGYKSIHPEADLYVFGEMGIGNTTSAAAIYAAILGGPGSQWAGPGSGVDESGVRRKALVIDRALSNHGTHLNDPLEAARRLGGREIAALAGAILRARHESIPVVIDGFIVGSALAVLWALDKRITQHCIAGHVSAEPAHRLALQALELKPLLSLDMRLGEGSGAAVATAQIKLAIALHNEMSTFEEASVSRRGGT
jgi:nicotinate-nucleotide--dimethylbenzimidazole phosphoribosyltransferase